MKFCRGHFNKTSNDFRIGWCWSICRDTSNVNMFHQAEEFSFPVTHGPSRNRHFVSNSGHFSDVTLNGPRDSDAPNFSHAISGLFLTNSRISSSLFNTIHPRKPVTFQSHKRLSLTQGKKVRDHAKDLDGRGNESNDSSQLAVINQLPLVMHW